MHPPDSPSSPLRTPQGAAAKPKALGDLLAESLPGILSTIAQHLIVREADQRRFLRSEAQFPIAGVRDFEFSSSFDEAQPEAVFDRLRWGGQLIFVSKKPQPVNALAAAYRGKAEWEIEHQPDMMMRDRFPRIRTWRHTPHIAMPKRLRRLLLEERLYYTIIRKVLIDPPSRLTSKHSYDVRLVRAKGQYDQAHATDGWVVVKRVPTMDQAISRLRQTCPDVAPDRLGTIAAQLVQKVFPIFLTREAAFLKLLHRDLPEEMINKTPKVLSMETDHRGLVRAMSLQWLRQGGEPLTQTEFARQSAELLRAVHERVGMMHLDLRLDNMLITEDGVCLIDFGSAVRIGEDIEANPMLNSLVSEMLASSQVTNDLNRQRKKNLIRAEIFKDLPYPPNPAFDLYALTTNLTRPHDNADFKGLVLHERESEEGQYFSKLRRRILKPDPGQQQIRDLHELCVELGIGSPRPTRAEGSAAAAAIVLDAPKLRQYQRPTPKIDTADEHGAA